MAALLFGFFGNAVRGYVNTPSLFYWWTFQWSNPGSETEHGWLILGLSAWLLWRNVRMADPQIADRGLRIADSTIPETGDRKPDALIPETEDRIPGETISETGNRKPDSLIPDTGDRKPDSRRSDQHEAFIARGTRQSEIRNPKSEILAPFAALLSGFGLHALGFAAQQTRLSIVAFLLFTWGLVRLAGGRRWGAAAAFPLGFMVFAIPINVLDSLGFWLRMGVVDASGAIARAAGIAVLQSGTQLVAPDGRYHYDVAAACSGVRSLTAMVALSLLAGYLNFRGTGRRALVVALCFPLVYVGNVARIVAIIFAAQIGGPKWGDVAHKIMGFGVFVIVLGGVLAAIAAIRRWWPEAAIADRGLRIADFEKPETGNRKPETETETENAASRTDVAANPQSAIRNPQLALVTGVVVALAAAEMLFLHHLANLPARGEAGVALTADGRDPVELPAFLGVDWIGRRTEVTAVERDILPADTGFSRKSYVPVADPRRQVLLSIVLSGRDRTSIHRPELCLVGQGWTVAGAAEHQFRFGPAGRGTFPATVLRVRREVSTPRGPVVVPQLTAYWFIGGDAIVATHWQRVLRDGWNRVAHARADRWAYVLMQTDASDGEPAALARMQAVLDHALPVFAPQKRQVRAGAGENPPEKS
ncbi:MAG: exosortase/archaeosortase family protein [Opitutaceae bacterium]|nr:exosortase/archaeosortase family protein [Opitutaceae bacterium]